MIELFGFKPVFIPFCKNMYAGTLSVLAARYKNTI
jgi:hypothetical protein